MTILEQDIVQLADTIRQVTGYSMEDICREGRATSELIIIKIAFCHFLHRKQYNPTQIARAINRNRTSVYYYLQCHDNLLFSDGYYKRCIGEIENIMNNKDGNVKTDNSMDIREAVLPEHL